MLHRHDVIALLWLLFRFVHNLAQTQWHKQLHSILVGRKTQGINRAQQHHEQGEEHFCHFPKMKCIRCMEILWGIFDYFYAYTKIKSAKFFDKHFIINSGLSLQQSFFVDVCSENVEFPIKTEWIHEHKSERMLVSNDIDCEIRCVTIDMNASEAVSPYFK